MDLSLPFDTDEREFVRGVQIGLLWKAAEVGADDSFMVYADCAEMVARIRERTDSEVRVTDAGDEWLQVDLNGAMRDV